MTEAVVAAPTRKFRNDAYRYCRLVHGWLSAIAFLALCFFSVTGLLLNHPDWLGAHKPASIEKQFKLAERELAQVSAADDPDAILMEMAAKRISLRGAYSAGGRAGSELFVRMQGVRGLSDLRVNLVTGMLDVVIEPAPTMTILNELHRAERAGSSWRLLVDIFAALLIVLSLVGYLIFLSMKLRLRTALIMTAVSTLGICAFFMAVVR